MSNRFRALTVTADGATETVFWDVADGTLPHLQRAVGGTVDVVSLDRRLDMWVNDEALLVGYPINPVATEIAQQFGFTHQPYYGPVVFTGGIDDEGDTRPLGPGMVEELRLFDPHTIRCCDCGRPFEDTTHAQAHWDAAHG